MVSTFGLSINLYSRRFTFLSLTKIFDCEKVLTHNSRVVAALFALATAECSRETAALCHRTSHKLSIFVNAFRCRHIVVRPLQEQKSSGLNLKLLLRATTCYRLSLINVSDIKKRIVGMRSWMKDDHETGHFSRSLSDDNPRGPVTFSSPRDPTSCHPLVTNRLHAAGASSSLQNAKYRRRATCLFIESTRSMDTRYRIDRATEWKKKGKRVKLRKWIKNKKETREEGREKQREEKEEENT